jgi:hypothetical protein
LQERVTYTIANTSKEDWRGGGRWKKRKEKKREGEREDKKTYFLYIFIFLKAGTQRLQERVTYTIANTSKEYFYLALDHCIPQGIHFILLPVTFKFFSPRIFQAEFWPKIPLEKKF